MSISNNLIYTSTESNVIRVWKLPEFIECDQLRAKAHRAVAMAVSGFNDQVCAAYSDGKVRVWHRMWAGGLVKHAKIATVPSTGSFVMSYITGKDKMMKHLGPITSLAINPSGDILYSASLDTTIKVWRLSDFRCTETFQAHPQSVNTIATGPDGVLYTASDDATIRVWQGHLSSSSSSSSYSYSSSLATAHSLILTLRAKNSPIKTLSLAAGGEVLYGGCTDGYIHFWLRAISSFSTCQLQYCGALQGHSHAVLCVTSLGRYLVSGSADATVRVWARETGGQHECVAVLLGHRGPVRCVVAYRTAC
ncbi:hypothetical protein CDL15_Pgr005464 [Punica granatum]|uniref:Uncharacterized protein n=1 Tax=Punica granatum TaxID=22663 RepID=A0A218WVW5_PUNGR|nr:hypothetical protein CDL15_Pgr005464 [Punica granatum]